MKKVRAPRIALFLSSRQLDDCFVQPALATGRLLARGGFTTIYGGSDHGMMQQVAEEIERHRGELIGITTTIFEKHCRSNLNRIYHTRTISTRTHWMITKADAVVALPGGVGTFQELATAIELKQLNLFSGPVILLNVDGFWNHFRTQLAQMLEAGFIRVGLDQLAVFLDTPEAMIDYLQRYFQPKDSYASSATTL